LSPIFYILVKETGFIPMVNCGTIGSRLEKIEHPVTKQIIVAAPNHLERKKVCDELRLPESFGTISNAPICDSGGN